jgi:hypothetical protein
MTNAYSETGQMAVCCQNLTLDALSSRSVLSLLGGILFKKFGLFLNVPCSSTLNKSGKCEPKNVGLVGCCLGCPAILVILDSMSDVCTVDIHGPKY